MRKRDIEKALEEEKQRADVLEEKYKIKEAECNGMFKASEYLELLRYTEELEEGSKSLALRNAELLKDLEAMSRVLEHNIGNYG